MRFHFDPLIIKHALSGDWEAWLHFFADAVIHTAPQAVDTINGLKRISGSAHRIHKVMLARPMTSPKWIQKKTQLSPATVNACLRELEQLGIVKEVIGQKRNRLYSYVEYIRIMNKGTELPR